MFIYSLKDVKSGFMTLNLYKNDDVAIRAFKNIMSDAQPNLVNSNPEDFELWCLGSYDQDSGIITSDVRFVFNSVKLTDSEPSDKYVNMSPLQHHE